METLRKDNGQFNGSIGDAAKNPPQPAPQAAPTTNPRQSVGSRPNLPRMSINCGIMKPGAAYTGVALRSRNPQTGDIRTEWAGEIHGVWDGEQDPAKDLLASFGNCQDGYLPFRAIFVGPHPTVDNADAEYNLHCSSGHWS